MSFVKPKKNLGQHFLADQNIALKIVDSLGSDVSDVLEIGPGMGVLTQYLLKRPEINLHVIEIDRESVQYLQHNFQELEHIWAEDFLKSDIAQKFENDFSIIGNFPYNISSQIFFRVLEMRNRVPEVVCMIQKEVAERIAGGAWEKNVWYFKCIASGTLRNRIFVYRIRTCVRSATKSEIGSYSIEAK